METTASFVGNVAVLSATLHKESWYNTFWSKFSNFSAINDDNGSSKDTPGGHPIKVWDEAATHGRDNVQIPFVRDLKGTGLKFGDSVLKGAEEDQAMMWMRAYVNQWRVGVKPKTGGMDEQRSKIYNLAAQAQPGLTRLLSKIKNQYIYQGLYYGINDPLSNAVTGLDGLGISKRLHPHWFEYEATDGLHSIGTDGITKTTDLLDAATLGTNYTLAKMDTKLLESLRVQAITLRIPQMTTIDGMKYWVLVVHPLQGKSLRADQDFKAFDGKKLESPELNGAIGVYAGFAIFEDIIGIRGWDRTNNSLYSDGLTELSSVTTNYNAIIVGNDAIGKANASDSSFESEEDDYKNVKGIAATTIDGINRVDFATEGTNIDAAFSRSASGSFCPATALENTSSMIVMTA